MRGQVLMQLLRVVRCFALHIYEDMQQHWRDLEHSELNCAISMPIGHVQLCP